MSTKPAHVFSPDEDEMIRRCPSNRSAHLTLSRRFGVTAEDIRRRQVELEQLAAAEERLEGLGVSMDAVELVFTDLCMTFQQMGERLKAVGEVLGRRLNSKEQVADLLNSVYQDWLVKAGNGESSEAFPVFGAGFISEHYILVPRPVLRPKEQQPGQASPAAPTSPEQP